MSRAQVLEMQEEAADWLLRRTNGLAAGEETEFQTWLSANPNHSRAFDAAQRTWQALQQPREQGDAAALECELERLAQRRSRRRKRSVVAAVALAAAVVAIGVFQPFSSVVPTPTVTVAVRPDRQTLPDGSTVELKAGAEIALAFTTERRAVQLLRGEALFMVEKDASRPFVVSAGPVDVHAVGTAFSVSNDATAVAVLVTEGRVAVARAPGQGGAAAETETKPAYLGAGERVRVPADLPVTAPLAIVPMTPKEVAADLAWRGRRVEFTATPLVEAVQLFNRQNALQLSIAEAALGRMQITGIFWADDPEGFVRLLEAGMNVRAERKAGLLALRRR
ncbi:MAG TPA: FecR domain-containing protein [Opitutaceae bacterium]|nr:FecR domain-containing protein [Opitutaceae bacterium]